MKNLFGINWGVRFRNKWFWVTIIPAAVLVIKAGAAVFGFELDLTELQSRIMAFVDALFALLAAAGVVIDQTTKGIADSTRAMSYVKPSETERDA